MSDDAGDGTADPDREYSTYDQARWTRGDVYEPVLAEKDSTTVTVGGDADGSDEEGSPLPDELTRESLELPGLAEPSVARHYVRLSEMNYGVESGPFPLGSCTMKYNPKFTEELAARPAAAVHPDRRDRTVQGALEVMYGLQDYLARIGGMDAVTLQPPAGAAGEFTGIQIARAYHEENGEDRTEVVVPESAHGTNFATAAMVGFDVVELPTAEDGRVDLAALREAVGTDTAALMLTNPNTLGLFERDAEDVADIVHDAGDMGFDLMHYNVHKTFATPHGGGGPGAGPVGVTADLAPYLPTPHVRRASRRDADGSSAEYELVEPEYTIGKVHGFQGNWLVCLKAYAYIARLGDPGLRDASAKAVLNANYLASEIDYEVPYGPFHHEFVASAGDTDAADAAKRMLDYGVHPPTTKWPEAVSEALMTEPTEVEGKDSLDNLAAAFDAVANEDEATVAAAPERTAARRIDQVAAARDPRLSWRDLETRN